MKFSKMLSILRSKKGISQRSAASDLKISQALLSHYENGVREPGLEFVCRACDYYGVSADLLLGRTEERYEGPDKTIKPDAKGLDEAHFAGGMKQLLELFEVLGGEDFAKQAYCFMKSKFE